MTLGTGGNVTFKPRSIEGAPAAASQTLPSALLLDGQQRLTSLYQVLLRGEPIHTITPRKQKVVRHFYIDIHAALDQSRDRDESVKTVPENRKITTDFGRTIVQDLSTRELEIANMMFPVAEVLSWNSWQTEFINRYSREHDFPERFALLNRFHDSVIQNFVGYLVPVIALDKATSKEAVCTVFEKVNTGGKALDAFELITATYAAEGYELRKDWLGNGDEPGLKERFELALRLPNSRKGVLAGVGNTDFLQAVSLFHTREEREQAAAEGRTGKELPQVSVTRAALLNLPLRSYLKYKQTVEDGFIAAAKFLVSQRIFRVFDLPYQSQLVPLAAILAELGESIQNPRVAGRVREWYWCGVFGELYGSTTETRVARDFLQVPAWARGEVSDEPSTVHETTVRADRLTTMRSRQSAAYKGVNALLMRERAKDFRSGQEFSDTLFFDENVDIHHIFPKDWCKKNGIPRRVYDSILNKSPLTARTNRKIGGVAPSEYLGHLLREAGAATDTDQTDTNQLEQLNDRLASHALDPELLWSDNFESFMQDRQLQFTRLIASAINRPVIAGDSGLPIEDFDDSEDFDDNEDYEHS